MSTKVKPSVLAKCVLPGVVSRWSARNIAKTDGGRHAYGPFSRFGLAEVIELPNIEVSGGIA
jgi:hypothetical protein